MRMRKLLLLCVVAMFAMLTVISVNMVSAVETENALPLGVFAAERDDAELLNRYLNDPIESSDYCIDADQVLEVIIEVAGVPSIMKAMEGNTSLSIAEYAKTEAYNDASLAIKDSQDRLVKALGSTFTYEGSFDVIVNAVHGFMKYSDYQKLPTNNAVNAMIAGLSVSRDYSIPETAASAKIMQVDLVREDVDLGFRGEGMLIGVIDTGLMVSHNAFSTMPPADTIKYSNGNYITSIASLLAARVGGQPLSATVSGRIPWQNSKVVYTFDYTANATNVNPTAATASALNHGTHVAGIAAGCSPSENFYGVAPYAQLAIFKVFGSSGGASTVNVLKAVQDATIIGCDVVNMSLGSPSGFVVPFADEIDIYSAARKAGMVITNSASNSYSSAMTNNASLLGNFPSYINPDYGTVGADSTYPQCFSIASNDPAYYYLATTPSGTLSYNEIPDRSMGEEILGTKEEVTYEYVMIPGFGRPADFAGLDVAGKIAIISRGDGVNFEDKLKNAGAAGAIAAFIYDNVDGAWINMSLTIPTIPGGFIFMKDGLALAEAPQGQRTITFKNDNKTLIMSDFSSWGIPSSAVSLVLKPEITAPGGNIYSSVPASVGGQLRGVYDWLGGTSMAAPNAAGSTAIVKQYLKEFMPDENEAGISSAEKEKRLNDKYLVSIRLLMSTAFQTESHNGVEYSPRKQGAGIIQLYKALKTSAYISVDGQDMTKIEAGDDKEKTGVYELNFNIVNFGTTDLTYIVGVTALTDELGPVINGVQTVSLMAYRLNPIFAVEGGNTVVVPAGQTVKVNTTLTLTPEDRAYLNIFPNGEFVDGFISLYQQDSQEPINLSVPFLAFYGDWEALPMFDAYEISGVTYQLVPTRLQARGTSTRYTMGAYAFTTQAGVAKPVGNIETAALSPLNTSSLYQTVHSLYFGALRNCWEAKFSIVDAVTGQTYFSHVEDGWYKTFMNPSSGTISPYTVYGTNSTYGFRFNGANVKAGYSNLPNNTRLFLRIDYMLEGQGTYKQYTAYPFTIDNTAPVIAGENAVAYEEGGRKYLELEVWDNQYLMAYDAWFTTNSAGTYKQGARINANTQPIPVYDQEYRGETHLLTFDITGKDSLLNATNVIQIRTVDYAYNDITWNVPVVAGTKIVKTEAKEYIGEKIVGTASESDFNVNAYNELVKYTGSSDYVVIPDYIVRIGPNAFADYMPKTIVINENVTAIAENAFIEAANYYTTIIFTAEYAPALEGGYVNTTSTGYNAPYKNFGNVNIVIPQGGIGYNYAWYSAQLNDIKITVQGGELTIDDLLEEISRLQALITELEEQLKELAGVSEEELEALQTELSEALAELADMTAKYGSLVAENEINKELIEDLLKQIDELKKQLMSEEELRDRQQEAEDNRKAAIACSTVSGSAGGWTGAIVLLAFAVCGAVLLMRKRKTNE